MILDLTKNVVAHVRQQIANGNITPCAPPGGKPVNWNENAITRLDAAIESIRRDEALKA